MDVKKVSVGFGDQSQAEMTFETGKMAMQANASVLARQGDTVVLATATMGRKREGMDYFPLLVDYEERLYAAGKIKGSRWVKREGKATDEAILTGRVIDRSIRPLFPDGMRNDVQVVVTVLSIDGVHEADMLSANAASAALTISDIPFDGPIGVVRVGKVDGQMVLNPSREMLKKSQMDLIVSGNEKHVLMVEAGAMLVSEEDIVAGIEFAQKHLAEICKVQNQFKEMAGQQKAVVDIIELNKGIYEQVKAFATEDKLDAAIYVANKEERESKMNALMDAAVETITKALITTKTEIAPGIESALGRLDEGQIKKEVLASLDKIMKKYMQKNILEKERRG